MACFIVPGAEAVVTTIVTGIVKSKEKEKLGMKVDAGHPVSDAPQELTKIPVSRKLGWLNNLLWGGSALLAFEHVWHGEVVPWFPFLTAAGNPADAAEMLNEMSTVGVAMAVLVSFVWVGMLAASAVIEKRSDKEYEVQEQK